MKLLKILTCLSILMGIAPSHAGTAYQTRPNVVLILADDLGYNDLSCYRERLPGQGELEPSCQTPNIDKLAADGMLFTDFYSGAAVCSPSRAALITGRNATRLGVYNWIPEGSPMHLRATEVTIAEMLKAQGYQTAHFGKWHLTSQGMGQPTPNDQGYDHSFYTYNNAIPSHENPVNFIRNGEAVGPLEGYSCQLVVDEALQWLSALEDKGDPFYINVWFNEPHEKVAAPEHLTSRHKRNQEYYGAIENMDNAVGRLMDYLNSNGLDQNTLVLFSSDNGSQVNFSNAPFRGEKCLNYEGGVRVPFIAKYTGTVPGAVINNLPGKFTDVLPTIAALTGAKRPDAKLDGSDLSELFKNQKIKETGDRTIFFYRYFHDPVTMIRKGDWVLLGYDNPLPYRTDYDIQATANLKPGRGEPQWSMWGFQQTHMDFIESQKITTFELYNLKNDIGQIKDVSKQHPEILESLKKTMFRLKDEMIMEGGNWYKE